MALLTDLIDPATLTGYTRAALADYEASTDSLVDFLPNHTDMQNLVSIRREGSARATVADFRAYDAEPDIEGGGEVEEETVRLLPITRNEVVSEFDQTAAIGTNEEFLLGAVKRGAVRGAQAIADRMELERGRVISTGRVAFHKSGRPVIADDFGRDADMTITVGTLWSDDTASALDDLNAAYDKYVDKNGFEPGALIGGNKVMRALSRNKDLRVSMADGTTRSARLSDVQDTLVDNSLPELRAYNRKVRVRNASTGKVELVSVLPDDSLFFLPPAGQSNLGGTYWGRTLTSTQLSWGLALADQPGIVAGVYRNEKPPVITEVIADAIGQPILVDANLSMAVKVL